MFWCTVPRVVGISAIEQGAFVADRKRWASTMKDLVDPSLMPFLEATPASAVPRTTVTAVVPKLVAPDYGAARVTFADGTGMDLGVAATGAAPTAVVDHLDLEGVRPPRHHDLDTRGAGVAAHVGEGLLHDAVGGELDAGR